MWGCRKCLLLFPREYQRCIECSRPLSEWGISKNNHHAGTATSDSTIPKVVKHKCRLLLLYSFSHCTYGVFSIVGLGFSS